MVLIVEKEFSGISSYTYLVPHELRLNIRQYKQKNKFPVALNLTTMDFLEIFFFLSELFGTLSICQEAST